jgi:oligopeptide/dipeptide ABC transporter ATP-binding protein
VAIARARAVEPRLVVLDEPTSALDVTVQAKVLALIERLRESHSLAYLLISHNIAAVARLCEEIAVLYRGQLMEQAPSAELLRAPAHPYTKALLEAIPSIDRPHRDRRRPQGDAAGRWLPLPRQLPAGDRSLFHRAAGTAGDLARPPGRLSCRHPVRRKGAVNGNATWSRRRRDLLRPRHLRR